MFKNVASQTVTLYAVDATTGLPETGDAANMLFYVSKDDGAVTLITANSGVPTEVDSTNAKGCYKIALAQSETNANKLLFSGKSSTSNIVVNPAVIYTTPNNFPALVIDASGNIAAGITGNITGNLSGSVGSVTGAVGSVTGNVGGNVAGSVGSVATGGITADSLAADANAEIATAVWTLANAIETGWTPQMVLRIIAAVLCGKSSGSPGSPVYRDIIDTKARVSGTATLAGRTAVTLDGS